MAQTARQTPADGAAQDHAGKAPGKHKSDAQTHEPVLITADQVIHDHDLNTITASGHVEVDQGGRILLADTLSYNLKQDVIVATGNVSLTEATGEVTFADYLEVTGDMKEAITHNIRILMIDDSRMAGVTGRRVEGNRKIIDKAVYSACKPCADASKNEPPLWQIKAERITHDETTHLIEYEDAWLEMGGWPIAYTPYFSHADPTVKRQSGLLPPSFFGNQLIGTGMRTPYYDVISPYQDLTLTPVATTNGGDMLEALYRWRTDLGVSKTEASVTSIPATANNGRSTIGWNIDSKAQYDLDEVWRAGWQLQRVSNQNYLQNYNLNNSVLLMPLPYLTTRPYLEGFSYNNYAVLEGYSFQSLSTPTYPAGSIIPQASPVVLPLASYSYLSQPGRYGDYWTLDTHAAAVNRQIGTDDQRVNSLTSWHLPYTAPDGELYKLTTSIRADAYNSTNINPGSGDQTASRLLPSVALEWRYPFSNIGEHSSQTITPIVVAVASPNGGNPSKIPNEDSIDFQLDDTNIFNPNLSDGYDRVLSGTRVAYGGQYTVVNRGLGAADILLGQIYQLHPSDVFTPGTGLDNHLSDYVGHVALMPSTNFNVQYDFRLNAANGAMRVSEITTSIGPRALNLQTSYIFLARLNDTSPYQQSEQITSTLTSQWSHYWSSQLYTIQNLGVGAMPLQTGTRLTYGDECFEVTGDAGVVHTTLQTFASGHYFMLRFVLKTLGQIPVDLL